jgi:Na+-transporting NADH:ubiquinone oxidoreductase subunit NqrF
MKAETQERLEIRLYDAIERYGTRTEEFSQAIIEAYNLGAAYVDFRLPQKMYENWDPHRMLEVEAHLKNHMPKDYEIHTYPNETKDGWVYWKRKK